MIFVLEYMEYMVQPLHFHFYSAGPAYYSNYQMLLTPICFLRVLIKRPVR